MDSISDTASQPRRRCSALKAHNTRIRWLVKSSFLAFACYGVIYEMDSKRPRRILVPTLDDWDPSCGCAASTADLDVKKWFVGGRRIKTLWRFPGTEIELQNYYDIVALKKPARRIAVNQENRAIKKLFAHKWNGNILVLKRSRYDKSRVVSITQPEIALINAMVHRWLEVRGVRYVS